MQILSNNVAILEDDEALSRYVKEAGKLIPSTDVALTENLKYINKGDWVVDGGAALGDHTAAYIERVGPIGAVFAFEPNPRYVECLKHNCSNANIFPCGLSDSTGPCRMNIGVGGNTGAGAITPDGEVESRMMRLDDLSLARLDFLKLDVEGYELKALLGGSETVRRCKPIIQMEWNIPAMLRAGVQPASVEDWLLNAGYRFRFFNGTRETGGELFAQLP